MVGNSGVLLLHKLSSRALISPSDGSVVVSLDPYSPAPVGTRGRMTESRSDTIRLHIGVTSWEEHFSRVESRLSELSELIGTSSFDLVAYEAAQLVSVREYWRMVYEEVVRRYGESNYATDLEAIEVVPYTQFSALMDCMRAICVSECIPAVRFCSSTLTRPVRQRSSGNRETWIRAIDHMWGFLQRVATSFHYRTGHYLRRSGRGHASGAVAMVVAQANKKGRLLSQLKGTITFSETAMADIAPAPTSATGTESRPGPDPIHDYLVRRLASLKDNAKGPQQFVNGDWDVLLTDQEHDPTMRQVFKTIFEQTQKRVITTPEGAQSLIGSEMVDLTRHVYVHDPRLVRCATSDGEAHRMAAVFGTEVIKSGYLAAIPPGRGLTSHLKRALVARLVGGPYNVELPLVLVNLDNELDVGMTRSGVPSMSEKLASLINLMDCLDRAQVRFVVTCKTSDHLDDIWDLCRGRSVAVFAHVPWRLLMSLSSVVIQRDSSLGPEAVAAGYPTIVWDDLGLPLASREWLDGNSPWVQRCTDESSLLAALGRIQSGIAPREHPQPWDLITPERQVAEWLVKDRAQRRAGLSD